MDMASADVTRATSMGLHLKDRVCEATWLACSSTINHMVAVLGARLSRDVPEL